MSKTVMLEWSSKKFEVTEEGYDLIKQLIREHQVCPGCGNHIDQEQHLLVGKRCLFCILRQSPSYTFLGVQRVNGDGEKIYAFLNHEGITLTSRENYSDKPEEDLAYSIEQAGFRIPEIYKPFKSQETIRLGRSGWKVYGKLSQSVVVLCYHDYHISGKLEITYLAYKEGETLEVNKRTTEHKNLLEKARVLAEKTGKGTSEPTLFTIIARLESVVYDAQRAFIEENQPQPEPATLFTEEIPQEDTSVTEEENNTEEQSTSVMTPQESQGTHIDVPSKEENQATEIPVSSQEIETAIHMQDPDNQGPAIEEKTQPKRKGRAPLRIVQSTESIDTEEVNLQEVTETVDTQPPEEEPQETTP